MKKIIKITIDIIMTLLFFVLMAYHFTGDAVHEYLGFLLFIFFILHHILNFNWYKNIYKGKYNFNRILNTFINTMLFLCMAGLMISGILFSQRVLGFLNIHNSGMFTRRNVYKTPSYDFKLLGFCIYVGTFGNALGYVYK